MPAMRLPLFGHRRLTRRDVVIGCQKAADTFTAQMRRDPITFVHRTHPQFRS
jgi:hypothetical protein